MLANPGEREAMGWRDHATVGAAVVTFGHAEHAHPLPLRQTGEQPRLSSRSRATAFRPLPGTCPGWEQPGPTAPDRPRRFRSRYRTAPSVSNPRDSDLPL